LLAKQLTEKLVSKTNHSPTWNNLYLETTQRGVIQDRWQQGRHKILEFENT
tara:strand:+ start:969 stop:1121 length:153 start_codon:yes stop_codon:yes gene_type:complete